MQNTQFTVKLINVNGQVIFSKKNIDNKINIDTHLFAFGMYTV
jgi:hypothetical protein